MSDNDGQTLDEVDLALVDALQVHPRASWTSLASVLELAPITLARRWQHLVHTGSAWVTVALSDAAMRGALLELTCRPGTAERVALTLADLPNVSTVGVTTGDFQVFALVLAPNLPTIADVLLRTLPIPDDVTQLRSHVFSGLFGGVVWRLGVINRSQTDLVREPVGPTPQRIRPLGPADRALFLALGHDGRRTYTQLADELGTSPQSVRRRLDRLRRHGDITFRCDVARPLAGWEAMALLWLVVPDADLRRVGKRLGAWAETRHCAAIPGRANLSLIVSLRSLDHLSDLLVRIAREHPEATIVDRRFVLRQIKVHGRIVDERGRSTRVVPVDPWATAP